MNSFKAIVVFISAIIVSVSYAGGIYEFFKEFNFPQWIKGILSLFFLCYTPFVFKGFLREMFDVLKIKPEKE